jgi:hypothetical protein
MKINEALKRREGTAPLLQTTIIPFCRSKWEYCVRDSSN